MKWRFEKKFDTTGTPRFEVEQKIKHHPYCFSQVYHPRWINSVYFDTFDLENYQKNIIGIADRTKYRVRWYGDQDISKIKESPVLEKKIKKGLIGIKERSFIEGLHSFDKLMNLSKLNLKSTIKNEVSGLKPKILVRYYRSYYQSFDRQFILTVDTDIQISDFQNRMKDKLWSLNQSVLELKYDHDTQCPQNLGAFLLFRQSRFSKYVKGIDLVKGYGL